MKWSFVIKITDDMKDKDIKNTVEKKAAEACRTVGESPKDAVYRVSVTFYQKKDRWRTDNPQIPREDVGRDLDNLIKPVFDGLGPIIGRRSKFKQKPNGKIEKIGEYSSRDSSIIEVMAKKLNSGSDEEYLSIEVEDI